MRSALPARRSERTRLANGWLSLARLWRDWSRRDRAAARIRFHLEPLEERLAPATNIISTVAGTGVGGYTGDGGPAVAAQLTAPSDVVVDPSGDLFIADGNAFVVREVNAKTGLITTVAGNGTAGYMGDGGPATSAELDFPTGVALDSSGNLYIADSSNNVVREVNATTHVITTIAGNGTAGYMGDGGPAKSAELDQPQAVALDSSGNLYIADSSNNVIREVNATTHVITTIAGNGTAGYMGDGGPAKSAELGSPNNLALDSAGNLFITGGSVVLFTSGGSVVREVNATTHVITTVAGNGVQGYTGDGGLATAAEMSTPTGLAVDSSGDLFIADASNDVVREVNGTTHVITTVAGNGTDNYGGDGGSALAAQAAPQGIALDSSGDLFIADSEHSVVRKVTVSNELTVTPTTLPYAQVGAPYVETLTAAAGVSPYTFTLAGGALPAGVFLSSAGALIGTPTAAGAFNFTVQVADSGATPLIIDVHERLFVMAAATPVLPINTIAGTGFLGYQGDGGLAVAARLNNPSGIAVDASGDVFIADSINNVVREVNSKTGVITTVAGNGTFGYTGDGGAATTAELGGPITVALDSSGDLFIADLGNNVVREVNAKTGLISTVAGNGTLGYSGDGGPATAAKLNGPEALALDASGDLFIVDTFNNVVRKVNATTHVITTVAGTGTFGFSGDGGLATAAQLSFPEGLALDLSGDLFIADTGNLRVREVSAATGKISTVAGDGLPGFQGDGGAATAAKLTSPQGLAFDSSGDLFIADTGNRTLREVNAKTGVITTLVGDGTLNDYQGDGGPAAAAQVIYPSGVGVDAAGNVYIVDEGANVVRKVTLTTPLTLSPAALPPTAPLASYTQVLTASGGTGPYTFQLTAGALPPGLTFNSNGLITGAATALGSYTFTVQAFDSSTGTGPLSAIQNYTVVVSLPISTVAGTGTAGYTGDNSAAVAAQMSGPADVALDASGDLFIVDTFNNVVREVNAKTGVITTVAGTGVKGYSGDSGLATTAELNEPTVLALDASGDLFIADTGNNVVREVNAKTGVITTVAGNGTAGYLGDSGLATTAELDEPIGLALDSSGDLFISDAANNVIREVNATTHVITTFAGTGVEGYTGDGGKAATAELYSPRAVAVDSSGDVFIADTDNEVIREVSGKTGVITTIAGDNVLFTALGDGGPATAASFFGPVSLALDTSGDLFIGDALHESIREVNAQTGIISTVVGGTAGYSGDGGPATGAQLLSVGLQQANGNSQQFGSVFGITFDSSGDLYIADTGDNVVRKVSAVGGLTVAPTQLPYSQVGTAYTETLAAAGGTGPYTYSLAAGALPGGLSLSSAGVIAGTPTAAGTFSFTVGLADSSAVPLVVDLHFTMNVLPQGLSSPPISAIAGGGSGSGLIVSAQAVDAAGDIFFAGVNNVIREVNATTGKNSIVAGDGVEGYTGDSGPAVAAELDKPQGVAVNAAGTILYIGDTDNDVVRVVNLKTGVINTYAGDGMFGSSGDGGAATSAELDDPQSLALDSSGDLFIADEANNAVREVNATTHVINRVAGDGVAGDMGDGGLATNAELDNMAALAVDSSGNLFIADFGDNVVRKVSAATHTISTFAGVGVAGYSGDGGPAAVAKLDGPGGLATDAAGDLFIADVGNSVVREVSAATGKISTIVGDGLPGSTGDGVPALTGQLYFPAGVALDGAGNIYIADVFEFAVRKITVTSPLTLGPGTLPTAAPNVSYSQTLTASGGTGPYTFRLTAGALPPGLALSAAGLILGTPTTTGSYTFTVQAVDASTGTGPLTVVQNETLTVVAPGLTLSPTSLQAPQVGVGYSQTITATGGKGPYTFTITSGQPPTGISLSSAGVLSGTTTAGGPFSFTIKATDSSGTPLTGSQSYSFTVAAPTITLSPTSLTAPQVGVFFSQTITAAGGTGPYAFTTSAGQLPAGLSLSGAGVLSGTPTAGGPFSFTVKATDSSTTPFNGAQSYSVTVAAPTILLSPTNLPGAQIGANYSQAITASGGTAPYTFQVTSGSLPAGLNLSLAGVISGKPTTLGSATFTVTAADSSTGLGAPYSFGQSYTLNVSNLSLSPTSLPAARLGAAYNQTITATGGTAPYTFQIVGGALPAGMSLSPGGVLGGTPTAGGSFSFTVKATDSAASPSSASLAYTLAVVVPAPAVVLNADGSLVQYNGDGSSTVLSPTGTILAVSEVVDGSGADDVFVITAGHTVWEHTPTKWIDVSEGYFQQISAATDKAGNAVVFGVLGPLSPFPNALYEHTTAGWSSLSPMGTILSVSAVGTSQGEVAFAIVAGSANLWQYSAATPKAPWSLLSGGGFAQVSAGLNGAGQAVAYGVLLDNSLWEYNLAFTNVLWMKLSAAGTILSATAGGADEVIAVTAGRSLWEHSGTVWSDLSDGSFTSATATHTSTGVDEVFAVLSDTSFWWYDSAFSIPWENLLAGGASATAAPQQL